MLYNIDSNKPNLLPLNNEIWHRLMCVNVCAYMGIGVFERGVVSLCVKLAILSVCFVCVNVRVFFYAHVNVCRIVCAYTHMLARFSACRLDV